MQVVMFTQVKTQYLQSVEKFLNPHTHIKWFKTIEWIENKTKLLVWLIGSNDWITNQNLLCDIDIEFVEYTKDEYAELCWFSSWAVAEEAVTRYKAEKKEVSTSK